MKRAISAAVILLVSAEIVARFYLGLGDPPIYLADPEIEYLVKPGEYHRFGHTSFYNSFSMRSREITRTKTDPEEFRVLIIGDSVVNGGAQTDQSELATVLIEKRLSANRTAFVGNVAAPSWGPANMLAYVKRFGLFETDVVILILNSDDYGDVPTFNVVGVFPGYPTEKPLLAIQEVIFRYAPTFFGHATAVPAPTTEELNASLVSLRELVRSLPRVIVAQHLRRDELGGRERQGYFAIKALLEQEGIQPIILGPIPAEYYRDTIHPNSAGQRVIADVLMEHLQRSELLQEPRGAVVGHNAPLPRR